MACILEIISWLVFWRSSRGLYFRDHLVACILEIISWLVFWRSSRGLYFGDHFVSCILLYAIQTDVQQNYFHRWQHILPFRSYHNDGHFKSILKM